MFCCDHLHPLTLWLPLFLYAEVHYRLRPLPNRLFMREPEILFDAPARIDTGQSLPVMLLIKDANRFPVELSELTIEILLDGEKIAHHHEGLAQLIEAPLWHAIREIQLPRGMAGELQVHCRLGIHVNGRSRTVVTDNYRRTRHAPLRVFADPDPLPGSDWYDFGELHFHSHLTEDQVEFGAPIAAAARMAEAQGFTFLAITDHSYDLDDSVDNFLQNDANLPKWKELHRIISLLNSQNSMFVVIPGEELSAGNSRGHNVHLLILNNDGFWPGSGDSAEKWLRNKPQNRIPVVLAHLQEQALALAAHPMVRPRTLERWIFNRDRWRTADLDHPRLDGFQVWNGLEDRAFDQGLAAWRDRLLAGGKTVLTAGNDAHGNFNHCRQIHVPFWSMLELDHKAFGRVRTGVVRAAGRVHSAGIIETLKSGAAMISNGPAARLRLIDADGRHYGLGETCRSAGTSLQVEAVSSAHYGGLQVLHVFIGDQEDKKEIRRTLPMHPADSYQQTLTLNDLPLPRRGYLRLQVISNNGERKYSGYTNPVFINCV
jgi:hypothetical protein